MSKRIIILFFIFLSCEKYDVRLNVSNNTKDVIYFTVSDNDSNFKDNIFKVPFSKNKPAIDYVWKLLPNSSEKMIQFGEDSWERYVVNSSEKKLNIYFFSEEVIINNSWEDICKNKLYLRHNQYSLEELEKIDWNIYFDKKK